MTLFIRANQLVTLITMKIKVLNRVEEDYTRERKGDVVKVFRNPDPVIHPFERAREYTRALNAVKLDKVFAKPFVRALSGHRDAVSCMSRSRVKLSEIASGSCDGEVRIWDLCRGSARWSTTGHHGFVRGVAFSPDGEYIWSCGDDKTIHMWQKSADVEDSDAELSVVRPVHTIMGANPYLGLDHHWTEPLVATCGVDVQV